MTALCNAAPTRQQQHLCLVQPEAGALTLYWSGAVTSISSSDDASGSASVVSPARGTAVGRQFQLVLCSASTVPVAQCRPHSNGCDCSPMLGRTMPEFCRYDKSSVSRCEYLMRNNGNLHLVVASSQIDASHHIALKQTLAPRSGHPSRPARRYVMFASSVVRLGPMPGTAVADVNAHTTVQLSKHCGIVPGVP
jgi:hypothetical protein